LFLTGLIPATTSPSRSTCWAGRSYQSTATIPDSQCATRTRSARHEKDDNKAPDLIRPGVNLWLPLNGYGLRHWNNDPHVVLEIDGTKLQPGLLKNMEAIAGYGAWWRYFADIPVSAISVSELAFPV
jgi:hypothetical protein